MQKLTKRLESNFFERKKEMGELKYFGFRPPPDRFATAHLKNGKLYFPAINEEAATEIVRNYLHGFECLSKEIDDAVKSIMEEGYP